MRYAGLGAFWGFDHPFNISTHLDGSEQTNNRAELAAVLRVLRIENRPVEIRTDSAYVHDGIKKHRFAWRARAWTTKRRKVRNADLWAAIDEILTSRPHGAVELVKVKGHATAEDVRRGRVALEDKQGNDEADTLAVAGAYVNPLAAPRRQAAADPGLPAH